MQMMNFSSAGLDNQAIADTFSSELKMDIDLPGSKPAFLSLSGLLLPDMGLTVLSGTPAKAIRNSEQASKSADDIILCMTRHANVQIRKNQGKEQFFRPGEAHVWQADQRFSCEVDKPYSTLMISLPSHMISQHDVDVDRVIHQGLAADSAEMRLLSSYTSILFRELAALKTASVNNAANHLRDLSILALGSAKERRHLNSDGCVRAARLLKIKNDISVNLSHPHLSASWIAQREGISPRYLRDLFAMEDTNFTDYVLRCRLKRAYEYLTDLQCRNCSITSIALESGFNDLSYFSRSFKREFGATPSEVRAEFLNH